MNIAIVEPRTPEEHVFSRFKMSRLGTPMIATIARDLGHNALAFCEDVEEFNHQELIDQDVVGFSIITPTARRGYAISDWLKRNGSKAVRIFGGVHATFRAEETLDHCEYVVRGEGEETFPELLEVIKGERDPSTVLGLSYWKDGRKIHNPDRPFIEDLDALPFPDIKLIRGYKKIKIKPIQTSRGCPYDCTFCSVTPMFGKGYRYRSPESVLDELERYDGETVFIYDDMFNARRERSIQIAQGIIDRGLRIKWTAQVRTNVVKHKGVEDEEALETYSKSGAVYFYIGFESVIPETLKAFKKGQSLQDIVDSIRILRKYRIRVHGMFVLGSEHDTKEAVRSTLKFAKRNKIDTVQFMILTPLPGAFDYKKMEEAGQIMRTDPDLSNAQHVVFWPIRILPSVLHQEVARAYKKFYSFPQALKLLLRADWLGVVFRTGGRYLSRRAIAQSEPDLIYLKEVEKGRYSIDGKKVRWLG